MVKTLVWARSMQEPAPYMTPGSDICIKLNVRRQNEFLIKICQITKLKYWRYQCRAWRAITIQYLGA